MNIPSNAQLVGHDELTGTKRLLFGLFAFALSVGIGYALVDPARLFWGFIRPGDLPLVVLAAVGGLLCVTITLLRPFFGLIAYTAFFFLRLGELIPALGVLHLERLIGILTIASLFFTQYVRDGRLSIDGSKVTRLLLLFTFFVALSVPLSVWPHKATEGFSEILKAIVFYLLIVQLVDSPRKLRWLVWIICAMVVYVGIQSFYAYVKGASFFAQGIDRAVGDTSIADNPNTLGTTMATTFFVVLWLIRGDRNLFRRILYAGGAGVMVFTMALTGSRASMLGFAGAMVAIWITSRQKLLLGALCLVVFVAGFVALPDQYQARYMTVTSGSLDGSSSSRLVTWATGLRMTLSRPLTGVGVGCFGSANGMEYSGQAGYRSWLEAHSLYVQIFAELGIIGATVFLLFLLEMLRQSRRTARALGGAPEWRFESALMWGVFFGLIVLLVSGGFGHSLMRRTWYIYGGLIVAVIRLYAMRVQTSEVVSGAFPRRGATATSPPALDVARSADTHQPQATVGESPA